MKKRIQELSSLSYNQVERLRIYGHISDEVWWAWERVWIWSAPRFGGAPGRLHEAFWNRHGKYHYYRRINKVRKAFNFKPLDFPAHMIADDPQLLTVGCVVQSA